VGRTEELRLLTESIAGSPAVVSVEGEAGIGKTRLVRELLADPACEGRSILLGHCHNLRPLFPFGPLIEALRKLAGADARAFRNPVIGTLGAILPELLPVLPPSPEPLGDARAERHRMLRAIRGLLEELGPTVLVLEDLHWADPATIEALSFVCREPPSGLAVVMTFRGDELPGSSALRGLVSRPPLGVRGAAVTLSTLPPRDVAELVSAILGTADVSEAFAQHLFDRTSGLPLAVEEVLKLLRERRDLVRYEGRWARRALASLQVPEAIRDSIHERMALLPAASRRLVQAASILAAPADEGLLARVAGTPPSKAEAALGRALSSGLLHEELDGRYGVRHSLSSQAVAESIPGPERRRMHERAGRALERSGSTAPARLADHFRHAGVAGKWIRHAEEAADEAVALGDDASAADLYRDLLATPELPSAAGARIAVKLGRAALHGMVHDEAVAALRTVLDERPLPKVARGEVRLHLAWLLDQCGDSSTCFTEMARAVPDLAARPDLTARVTSNLALPIVLDGHIREHVAWLGRSTRALVRVRDAETRVAVLVNRAATLLWLGDPEGWRAVADIPWHGGSMQERRQLVRGCVNLAQAALALGHFGRATSFLEQAASISRELGYERFAGTRSAVALEIAWAEGRWDDLQAAAEHLAGDPDSVSCVQWPAEYVRGSLELAGGSPETAEDLLRAAGELARSAGSVRGIAAAAGRLSAARLAAGDVEAASELAQEAVEVLRAKGAWMWCEDAVPVAVDVLTRSGRIDEAHALTGELAGGLRTRDAPSARAALAMCRGALAFAARDVSGAARWFGSAAKTRRGLPHPYAEAQAEERHGLALLEADRPEDAIARLGRALEAFRGLGATRDAGRLRAVLRDQGVVVPSPGRRGRKGYGDRMSPRELEVARHAALGWTNRRIAEALFLSPKTVEHHLASAMRKLRVTSRTALSVAVAAEGGAAEEPAQASPTADALRRPAVH
jgi:DNA-binding CsgD family transcriptional regulator